jgi:multiple antibiotic resistance protein
MDNLLKILIHDIIALITIINPIAAASIMISLISPVTESNIQPIATKASITVLVASLITLFSGEIIFKIFGINVLSLKVIGGVILMLVAINMAYGHPSKARHTQEEQSEAKDREDISIVPLGIPILFGPGVIATIIVLNTNNKEILSSFLSYLLITISIIISSIVVFLTLRYASSINRALGVTGIKILTRIMGLIVGAIGAQFIVGGVKGLWNML